MRSLSFLLLLVLISVVLCVSADAPCKIDGVVYTCPVILSKLDRWAVEYRHYEAVQLLGYIPNTGPITGSPTASVQTGIPVAQSYFTGQNSNGSSWTLTRPIGVEILQLSANVSYCIPFTFLPTSIVGNPPQPNNPSLILTPPLPSGSFDPIAMTFTGPATDAVIFASIAALRTILDKHGELYDPQISFFFTYNSTDTTAFPNEVWQMPEDSEYGKQRIQQLKKIIKLTE